MIDHLPVLQVVVVLLSAPICFLLKSVAAKRLAIAIAIFSLLASLGLLAWTASAGTLSYALGGWPPPWGIEYRIDVLSAIVLVTVSSVATAVLFYGQQPLGMTVEAERVPAFYCLYLLCLAGLLGIAATGDFFNLFVFLEISSLASYVLVAMGRDRRALTAAYRYLIMGTIGATFYIIGIGLLYMVTGSLNMADMASILPAAAGSRTLVVAFTFLVVGLGLKLGLFPLHGWLPSAYVQAPSAVSPFLAATSTKVALYILIRVVVTLFPEADPETVAPLLHVLAALALLGLIAGSVIALFQDNSRRMLAYSGIAQIGAMVAGVCLLTPDGLAATIVTLFNHALTMALLFMALNTFRFNVGAETIDDLAGLAREMPRTALATLIGGCSLVGLPLTSGFISKWVLAGAAIDRGWWPVATVILLTSFLTLAYMGKIIQALYLRPPKHRAPIEEEPLSAVAPMLILAGANILFGVVGWVPLHLARSAAIQLLGTLP